MSKSKYTPGPWEAVRHSNSIVGIRRVGSTDDIAHVLQPAGREEQKANAALFEAAPEMLMALYAARGQIAVLASADDVPDVVQDAIAKAEGRK